MAPPNKMRVGGPLIEFNTVTFNWLVDNVQKLLAAQKPKAKPSASLHPRLAVQVENTTSGDIEPGQILGIAGPIFDLDEVPNQVYSAPNVEGVTPDSGDHASRFVVALDFIPQDKVGPALIMGLAWVRVNLTEDESDEHTHCEVETGETVLQSSTDGIEMIYRGEPDESENEIWALVLLGGGGGGGGDVNLTFGYAVGQIPASTGKALVDAGEGEWMPVDDAGEDTEAEPLPVINRYHDTINDGAPIWVSGGIVINAGCNTYSEES